MNKKKILIWVLFFLIFFAVMQLFQKKQQPQTPPVDSGKPPAIVVSMVKDSYSSGEEVIVKIQNNTADKITVPANCPKNPLRVMAQTGDKFEERIVETKIKCDTIPNITIDPNAETKVSYSYWNHALFGTPGKYKVELALKSGTTTGVFSSAEFSVNEAGFWRKFFNTIFYQPLYNILVFFIMIAPFHDLGFAIILLTLLIRLILLVPSQRAIVSQRKMQELQPKLAHVKKKYAGNQEMIAKETMELWKQNKVNPFGSCLPILIQFPVLIALFYVIQNGLNPDNLYLIYEPLKNVDLSNIHTNFIGLLDLTKVNTFVLPLIIGALQFFQLKLTMVKNQKNKTLPGQKDQPSEMETANKAMIYIMPVMIAMFTASVPAGVGLYWGVSTLFAVGQQMVANRSKKYDTIKAEYEH